MELSTTASAAQLALSAATAAVAFAVYRVQADKLFLEMRDNRIAALDRYKGAINARLIFIGSVSRDNVEHDVSISKLQDLDAEQWAGELDIKRWYGAEMEPLMNLAARAAYDALQRKITWCQAERGKAGSYEPVNEMHLAAVRALEDVLEAANPYIRAGRRGLSIPASWSLWRSRVRARRHLRRSRK